MPSGPTASSTSTANVGIARPMFVTLMASVPPRPTCPSQSATGRANAQAIATERAVTSRCSASRVGTPFAPCQWAPSPNQASTSPNQPFTRGSAARA
jgi:hypothetical protein